MTACPAIAEDLFERMHATAYANINSTTFPDQTSVTGYQGFAYAVTLADDTPVASTKQVTVTVTYTALAFKGPVNVSFTRIFASP